MKKDKNSVLLRKYSKNYPMIMEKFKSISLDKYKHEYDANKYLSIMHFVYVNRYSEFLKIPYNNENCIFLPLGKITPNNYAYVSIPHMDYENYEEYNSRAIVYRTMKIIAELAKNKPQGWVIDLRGNTGGIIEYFIASICQIVDKFELIGYDKDNNPAAYIKSDGDIFTLEMDGEIVVRVEYPFKTNIKFENIYVIIDNNTASAAEILTILLRKYKNAKVCGERSYGIVSLMQSTMYNDFTFTYPAFRIEFDNGAEFIVPDIDGIPEYLYPNDY